MRLTFCVVLLAAIAFAAPLRADVSNAGADHGGGGETTVTGGGEDIEVVVENDGYEFEVVIAGRPCTYRKVTAGELASLPGIPYSMTPDQMIEFIQEIRNDDRAFFLYVRACGSSSGTPIIDYFWIEEASPADVTELVRQELIKVAPGPKARFNPDATLRQLVGLATFVWLDDTTFVPITAEVSIPGLTATATATPASLVLIPGDGTMPLECDLDSTAYREGADPESNCTHTFRRVSSISSTGKWNFTVSLEWSVSWTNSLGESGVAEPLRTESVYPLTVIEIQPRTTNG